MSHVRCSMAAAGATAGSVMAAALLVAQVGPNPVDALPNPYRTVEDFFQLPAGRAWGAISAIDIDRDGRSVWIAERCGGNSDCPSKPALDPILLFDASGRLVRSFGAGLIMSPHGIHVDPEGNVWVTDYSDNGPRPARGVAGRGSGGTVGAAAGATKGHQVMKFSPDGRLLMTLGAPGGARDPEYFYQPNDIVVARDGTIFVAEGHGGGGRILRFDGDGRLLGQFGRPGSGPGEFSTPHALALDAQGRLFVGDRGNNRIQLFTQDGLFIAEWRQFGRPSGLHIDGQDMLYVADSESSSERNGATWGRGIRIGHARDGSVTAFIPDPWHETPRPSTTAAEGLAADAAGNVYGAEVTERRVQRYERR